MSFALKLCRGLFLACAALVPIFGVLIHRGIVPLLIVGALAGAATIGIKRSILAVPYAIIGLLVATCLWAVASSVWAIEPAGAMLGAAKLTGNLVFGLVFLGAASICDPDDRRSIIEWFTVGWLFALAILSIEIIFHGPIFSAIRNVDFDASVIGPFWLTAGTATLILTFYPVAMVLYRRLGWPAPAAVFAILIVITIEIQYGTGSVATATSAGAIALGYLVGRRIAPVLAVLFVVIGLSTPFAFVSLGDPSTAASAFDALPNSARHRIGIWNFASHHILEHPVRGWGMNAARELPDGKKRIADLSGTDLGESMPLHPHNMLLQFWLELGLPGALAYLIAGAFLLYRAAQAEHRFLALGFLFSAMTFANLSFGAWQGWWIAAIWFGGALTIVAAKYEPRQIGGSLSAKLG